MQLVKEAFNVLRDKDKRRAYDQQQGISKGRGPGRGNVGSTSGQDRSTSGFRNQSGAERGGRGGGGGGAGGESTGGSKPSWDFNAPRGEFWDRLAKPWRSWQDDQNVKRWRHQIKDKWKQASDVAQQASVRAKHIDWAGVEKQGRQGWEQVKRSSNQAWRGLRPRLQSLQTPAGRARNSPEVLEIKRSVQQIAQQMEREGRLFAKDPKGRALRAQQAVVFGELRDRAQDFARRRPGTAAASAALGGMILLSLFTR